MTEAKHTPGPWKPVAWPDGEWSSPYRDDCITSTCQMISDGSGNAVAIAVTCYPQWSNKAKDAEMDANARLLAAAPDQHEALLEAEAALECALDRLKSAKPADYAFHVTSEYKALEVVRAAIAKATE